MEKSMKKGTLLEYQEIKRTTGYVTLSDQRERRVSEDATLQAPWVILHSATLRSE